MPGRLTLTAERRQIEERFGVGFSWLWKPRYNIAPSQQVPIITNTSPEKVVMARWGLIPSWSTTIDIGQKMINARSETLTEKPSFSNLLKTKRCLVPADGFYEWKTTGTSKQPYHIHLADKSIFAFAGLWDVWKDRTTGQEIVSFSIITTEPNDLLRPIHDRMGVILPYESERLWLDKPDLSLLVPYMSTPTEAVKVSKLCNYPSNDVPECVLPLNELM